MILSERDAVMRLGDTIGYGRLMQLASEIWRAKLLARGLEGGEFVIGPCQAFMVVCKHKVKDRNGHCDICCGSGLITKGVRKLVNKKCKK